VKDGVGGAEVRAHTGWGIKVKMLLRMKLTYYWMQLTDVLPPSTNKLT